MAKDLMGWVPEQLDWVKGSLRRSAVAVDHSVEQADADFILDDVRGAAGAGSSVHSMTPIDATHLGGDSRETLGPCRTSTGLPAARSCAWLQWVSRSCMARTEAGRADAHAPPSDFVAA